jgi:hypothetical protein
MTAPFVDHCQQLILIERLSDPAGGPGLLGFLLDGVVGFSGEKHDWQTGQRRRGAQLLDQVAAVHHRHVQIRDDQARLARFAFSRPWAPSPPAADFAMTAS